MLSQFYTKHIGFVLLPGCHDADLVNTQTLLSFHPNNRYHFIGVGVDRGTAIPCQSGLTLRTNAEVSDFRERPLDVLVIVGHDDDEEHRAGTKGTTPRATTLEALKDLAAAAERVVAVGDGVLTLAHTGLLTDHCVRCAPSDTRLHERLKPLVGQILVDVDGNPAGKSGGSHNNSTSNLPSLPTVCESGKFVTAGPCTGAMESALWVLAQLRGTFVASFAELFTEYAPRQRFPDVAPVLPDNTQPPLRVGVLLTEDMYLPDVIGALSVFRALPNCQVIGVVAEDRDIPTAMGPTVADSATTAMSTLEDCPQLDVFVVGLVMPWVLCHSKIVEFVRTQAKGCRAMIGVCAGALLLGSAGLLEGRPATTNFQMKPLLPAVGAVVADAPASGEESDEDLVVVDDDKFVHTAGPIVGSYEAALLVVAKLYGAGVAAHIEQNVLRYQHPHPPFGVGHARKASLGLLLAAKVPVLPFNPIYRYCAQKGLAKTHRNRAAGDNTTPKSSNPSMGMAIGAGILVAAMVVQTVFLSPTTVF